MKKKINEEIDLSTKIVREPHVLRFAAKTKHTQTIQLPIHGAFICSIK